MFGADLSALEPGDLIFADGMPDGLSTSSSGRPPAP